MARQKINYQKYYSVEKDAREESDRKYWRLRKRFDFWLPLGIIGLLMLISLFVYATWQVWPSTSWSLFHTDSYIIYKNECHTVPITAEEAGIKATYYNKSLIKDITFSREICNQTIVDSIPYNLNCNFQDYNRKDYPIKCFTALSCLSDCVSYELDYIPLYKDDPPKGNVEQCTKRCTPSISKKEINKEWLTNPENNCRCIDYTCPFGCEPYFHIAFHTKVMDCQRYVGRAGDGFAYKDCDKSCTKYQCGDFEVVKQ